MHWAAQPLPSAGKLLLLQLRPPGPTAKNERVLIERGNIPNQLWVSHLVTGLQHRRLAGREASDDPLRAAVRGVRAGHAMGLSTGGSAGGGYGGQVKS